jgi:hypothetical protein
MRETLPDRALLVGRCVGPFAETKEQLLGFFVVECASLGRAIETARELRLGSR